MMNMMMVTSLNTYTNNMKMQMKWKEKQASGNYTSGRTLAAAGKTSEGTTEAERLLESQFGEEAMEKKASAQTMQTIRSKMMAGKRLSSDEMEYLKENAPDMYQKARSIEMEKEAYERELKQCKTKEEVQRVKMSHAASAMATVKDIETNPNIPKGAKLGLMMQQLQKTQALGDTEREFVASGAYKRLPTEAERLKAEKEMEKAKKAEMGIEDRTDDTAKEAVDRTEEEQAERNGEAGAEGASGMDTDGTETGAVDRAETGEKQAEAVRARAILIGHEKSRMEAEVTPEARKVRRARAQAAYARNSSAGITSSQTVDIRVN